MAENLMLVKNKIGNRLHFEIITVMCASRFFKFVFPNYNSKLLTKYHPEIPLEIFSYINSAKFAIKRKSRRMPIKTNRR